MDYQGRIPLNTSSYSTQNFTNREVNFKGINQLTQTNSPTTFEVKAGQIIKGEVVDIRYNKVMIRLDPENQIVTAKLEPGVELTIGQTANFLVTEENPEQLTLKYMTPDQKPQQELILEKALIESGFPKTDRNKAIVQELLKYNLSIGKQTLQSLIKHAHLNKSASPQTLVLMYKHNLPMTKENILQYEAYQSGTHPLRDEIIQLQSNMFDMLFEPVPANEKESVLMHQNFLNFLGNTKDRNETPLDAPLHTILSESEIVKLNTALDLASSQQVITLGKAETEFITQLRTGQLPLRSLFDTPFTETTNHIIQHLMKAPDSRDLMGKLNDRFDLLQHNEGEIAATFSQEEREELLLLLKNDTDIHTLKDKILQGKITVTEVLDLLKDQLAKLSETDTKSILHAPVYEKLLKEALELKWSLSPSELTRENAISDFYEHLQKDFEALKNLLNQNQTITSKEMLQEPINHAQDNINFMKDLNALYPYLQLPVQFKDQTVHSELYVFSKKKNIKDSMDNLNVLLHLDMPNLGALDIHLHLQQHNLFATFKIEDQTAIQLIKDNITMLSSALGKKGYIVHSEVKFNPKKLDFSKDFIEQASQDSSIKRYSFDIRT